MLWSKCLNYALKTKGCVQWFYYEIKFFIKLLFKFIKNWKPNITFMCSIYWFYIYAKCANVIYANKVYQNAQFLQLWISLSTIKSSITSISAYLFLCTRFMMQLWHNKNSTFFLCDFGWATNLAHSAFMQQMTLWNTNIWSLICII